MAKAPKKTISQTNSKGNKTTVKRRSSRASKSTKTLGTVKSRTTIGRDKRFVRQDAAVALSTVQDSGGTKTSASMHLKKANAHLLRAWHTISESCDKRAKTS